MSTEPWVSVDDVAQHLSVTKDSVYRWIEQRGLPAHKIVTCPHSSVHFRSQS